jgi:Leucine-rich repeat (LRR) protein
MVGLQLRRLKAKSLLESLGDGVKTSIGIHDLWRAFSVAETKSGVLKCQRWMYEAENCTSELVETFPSGTCWESVMRMAFVNCEMISKLERVNFSHFPNVAVLKIEGLPVKETLVLDLSGLIRLKSLEVSAKNLHALFIQGLPRDLIFLRAREDYGFSDAIIDGSSQQLVDKIGCLKELQYLELKGYLGDKLPDMTRMISIQVAIFRACENVATLTGLSSKLTNLKVLQLVGCERLQTCPDVGDLVQLEVLNCRECAKLEGFPDLRKLIHLRKLDISHCGLITELQGLDDLVALEEFHAGWCNMSKLPDMSKLSKLQVLDIGDSDSCKTIHPGIEKLISLKELKVDFGRVVERPNLRWLTKLQNLSIDGCSMVELGALHQLTMLGSLTISGCRGVDVELPDLRSLVRLQTLRIWFSGFKNVMGLMNLSALEDLSFYGCNALERLPDMQRLTRLKSLLIEYCAKLRGWDGTWGEAEVSPRRLDGYDLPDSEKLVGSRDLPRSNGRSFDLTTFGSLSQLQKLFCEGDLPFLELPDLSNFPRLETLSLSRCQSLRQLSSREPMNSLSRVILRDCSLLAILPDLFKFPRLLTLTISRCPSITALSSSGPLVACAELDIGSCSGLQYLPDLGKSFPALKTLELWRCRRVTTLSSSVPMPALTLLMATGCRRLSRDDLYQLQASVCPQCHVNYDEDIGYDDGEDSDGVEIHDGDDDNGDLPNPKRSRISGVGPGNDLD